MIDDTLGLYIVADGMGGHLGGKVASQLAVSLIAAALRQHDSLPLAAAADSQASAAATHLAAQKLAAAVRHACAQIYAKAQSDSQLHGMGTTATVLWLQPGPAVHHAVLAHVGDSRCYLLRDGTLLQLTEDHSLVHEQVKSGLLSELQARTSRLKNIITRSVGFERDVAVDTIRLALQLGDRLLLCSDGLINMVEDAEIGLILAENTFMAVPDALIDLANQRGGDDNITVVCLETRTSTATPPASPPSVNNNDNAKPHVPTDPEP